MGNVICQTLGVTTSPLSANEQTYITLTFVYVQDCYVYCGIFAQSKNCGAGKDFRC
jgi:hypothetical protein